LLVDWAFISATIGAWLGDSSGVTEGIVPMDEIGLWTLPAWELMVTYLHVHMNASHLSLWPGSFDLSIVLVWISQQSS
jgi:hypothetical protein